MDLRLKLVHRLGRSFQKLGAALLNYKQSAGLWIDVGANLGQKTFHFARRNPLLIVYAFEPNLKVAMQRVGLLPNFTVIPMAVAEHDGCADFYIAAYGPASSLYPFNPEGVRNWVSPLELKVEDQRMVPTIRLDTFMNLMNISQVDYLKVDAQGADFSVIKSAGARLADIRKITLEVAVTPVPLYIGASNKDEIIAYLEKFEFTLIETREQSYNQEENLTFVNKFSS